MAATVSLSPPMLMALRMLSSKEELYRKQASAAGMVPWLAGIAAVVVLIVLMTVFG